MQNNAERQIYYQINVSKDLIVDNVNNFEP